MSKNPTSENLQPATRLVTAAREFAEHGMVNPPIFHASTILFPNLATYKNGKQKYRYARRGTPTSRALETAIASLEGGFDCKVAPSGLAAVSSALLAFLKTGDHVLMVDSVYGPARHFCNTVLKRFGIETTYYDPQIGARISELLQPNTRVVYCESPGSQTMEVQDVPAIAAAAHAHGAIVMLDNTWSAGHYFKAFEHGCDVSIQAATKYIVGHSDVMLGSVVCNEACWPEFKESFESTGLFAGPDDMYLALRGLRTLDVRLERHMKNALAVANWLRGRQEVETVLYPALPNATGHELWKRDFTGACGLFSIILKPVPEPALEAMVDGFSLFKIGDSWGGFESLVVPFNVRRSATNWLAGGPALRLHIGLESPDDLIADLQAGFARLNATP